MLDVFRSPGNFIDGFERSYGSNATHVGELGRAFMSAQQAGGVAATAKHFPGLGAASRQQNTDEGPVVLGQSLAKLRAIDETPYRAAIAARASLIMLSWAVYPALDPSRPAGLSRSVVEGELRHKLGFRGVTITDGLEAAALANYGSAAERALLAAGAGADLILCSGRTAESNSPLIGTQALAGIASAITAREITRTTAERAMATIIALRSNP